MLGIFILLFAIGVFILTHTGKQIAPMPTQTVASANGENFGQFLVDHYALLVPFFEKNQQNLVRQGEPLLIRVMGDLILINMAIGWVLTVGIAIGFSSIYARRHAQPQEAVIYATWRLGLDIGIFLMASLGAFGWELLQLPIPVWPILILFGLAGIIAHSILVANVYGTNTTVSTLFYIFLLTILILAVALVSGAAIKKRMAIVLAQFFDVQSVTAQLNDATAEGNRQLADIKSSSAEAHQTVDAAQDKINEIDKNMEAVRKEIETEQNSEAYVYARIMRIRAQGDLPSAQDQLEAFIVKFPTGTLINTAKAQLDVIKQDIVTGDAQKKLAEANEAQAAAQARADLLARASRGEVTIVEMRHALLGKTMYEVQGLFGKPTESGPERWGYASKMVQNPQTNEKFGLSVYFTEDVVQSVDYYYGNK